MKTLFLSYTRHLMLFVWVPRGLLLFLFLFLLLRLRLLLLRTGSY